jgi:hypothetical protein
VYYYYRLVINEYLELTASHGVVAFICADQVSDERKKEKKNGRNITF